MDQSYDFKGHDVTKVFEHARMLDFSTPINLLLNPEYRGLTDKLASLDDSEWFLDFDEEVGGHFFNNELCDKPGVVCMLEKNNIGLIRQHRSRVHAIYSDGDRMFSTRQVECFGACFLAVISPTSMEPGIIPSWSKTGSSWTF